jgi:N6-L-threonylcarbamoyladenine synthase
VESITWIIEEALHEAGIEKESLSAIAVTQGPGLVGSLLVGMVSAKALAAALEIPFIGVHHIAGHIYANQLVEEMIFPAMALVVSGGHTELVHLPERGKFEIIGQTRDDAAGEAYDKVARALGLPYPGGPHVDRLAHEAAAAVPLPRAWLEPGSYDFSFSGLKSAVLSVLNQAKMKGQTVDPAELARGFQESVIDVLVEKTMKACKQYGVKQVLLAGGVAANRGLREALTARCDKAGLPLIIPPLQLCTDNAAMIAAAAFLKWERGAMSELDMKAEPLLKLESWIS